ncbi:MAG: 3'-5' exonuclease [Ignavibacteriaceae bacterium]|jgi:DNA polymerase-3 subunit epsilon|nr:3'-5' exonuclease [Ignavibacteriaceae bacterium]
MTDKIKLERPLIFFDLETTGTSVAKDRIVEIFCLKYCPDGSREELYYLLNPTIPIPGEASSIHNITDDDVKDSPVFSDVHTEVFRFFLNCDVAGYNILNYDVPILLEELARAGVRENPLENSRIIDLLKIYFKKETRTLADALKLYANESLVDAHSAKADVYALPKILLGQLSRYPEVKPTVEFLAEYSSGDDSRLDYENKFIRNKEGKIVLNFGKFKGDLAVNQKDYLLWMLSGDFTSHTKNVTRQILKGKLN